MMDTALSILVDQSDAEPFVQEEEIAALVKKHENERGGLIATLEEIQGQYGYLPAKALGLVSQETSQSLVDIYAVATFYRAFSLKPKGKHVVSVCLGTACHVRGAPTVADELKMVLGVESGETTEDKEFTLETVNCLGACALGPVVVIDGHYFSMVKRTDVKKLIQLARDGIDETADVDDKRTFPIIVSCPRCNHSLMDHDFYIEGCPSIRTTVSYGDKHGWIRLSSIYGRYNVFSEFDIELDSIMHFFCPHCHGELITPWECPSCSAPMISMIVRGGGMARICSRRGCREHMLFVDGSFF